MSLHLSLAEHLARRFRNRGEPYDDLVQVAMVGLLKAIDGFDPDRGWTSPATRSPRWSVR
ncbi:MAG: sigma factor [Hymenobacter sp.]